jgi:hypothetical protein
MLHESIINNKSIEFRSVYSSLKKISSSYNLVILKQLEIITILLESMNLNEAVTLTAIDLVVALIKDLRGDIYPEFMKRILPKLVTLIDINNTSLLDKVFICFSYAFKYLLTSILKDFPRFYKSYFEVLAQKNSSLRKFACQSISFILRKCEDLDQTL